MVDEAERMIKVFDEEGVPIVAFFPGGVCRNVRIEGTRMYVSLMNGGAYTGIKVYDISTAIPREVGRFSHPTMRNPDISLIVDGRVYVADWGANSLYIYSTNGLLASIVSEHTGGKLVGPHSLVRDDRGRFYITEAHPNGDGYVKVVSFEK